MREIRFRAWAIQVDGSNGMSYDIRCLDGDLIESLMQYTGLRDKNGKDIYEGDFVKSNSGKIAKVRINNCCLEWNIYTKSEWDNFGDTSFGIMSKGHANRCEVIGNIYEHPHLLGNCKPKDTNG